MRPRLFCLEIEQPYLFHRHGFLVDKCLEAFLLQRRLFRRRRVARDECDCAAVGRRVDAAKGIDVRKRLDGLAASQAYLKQ